MGLRGTQTCPHTHTQDNNFYLYVMYVLFILIHSFIHSPHSACIIVYPCVFFVCTWGRKWQRCASVHQCIGVQFPSFFHFDCWICKVRPGFLISDIKVNSGMNKKRLSARFLHPILGNTPDNTQTHRQTYTATSTSIEKRGKKKPKYPFSLFK